MIRDNERLIAENRQHAKEAAQHRDTIEILRGDLGIANAAIARAVGAKELLEHQLETKSKEATKAQTEAAAAERRESDLMQKIASIEAEVKELRASNELNDSKG